MRLRLTKHCLGALAVLALTVIGNTASANNNSYIVSSEVVSDTAVPASAYVGDVPMASVGDCSSGNCGGTCSGGSCGAGGSCSSGDCGTGSCGAGGCGLGGGLFGSCNRGMAGCQPKKYDRPDLFYNFYSRGNCNSANAQMYISPMPVPHFVGHTFGTYQPLYPHEFMYWHKNRFHNEYDNGRGMNRTKVKYYAPPIMTAAKNLYWNKLRLAR